jgi:hypothetical protein
MGLARRKIDVPTASRFSADVATAGSVDAHAY